ncbi:MAG: DUF4097 family beta strand repeat-containing protein [Acidobacteriota bacterium]
MKRAFSIILPAAVALCVSLPASGAAGDGTQTRAVRQAFPVQGATELRLANLAGRIELVRANGAQVVIDATIHAQGDSGKETQQLLQGMKWVRAEDRHGNEEWTLSYPVKDYRGFSYPKPGAKQKEESWFLSWLESKATTSTTYRGEKVKIYYEKNSSAPILYADLRIALPAGSHVVVRNVVGDVRGGQLEGALKVDTGSGKVEMAAYDGNLVVDTGSGDVILGSVRGETSVDTGSGDVVVRRLVGNGKMDTGSGDVTVEQVSAGRLYIDTGSGDVVVRGGSASRVIADTGSGNVTVSGVELEELEADTGSGDVVIRSSLDQARRISADTGSGDVEIHAGPNASFDIESDQGSGDLEVGYADARLRKDGKKVVGARRGDGKTVIRVETGSGDCTISPRQES